MAISICISADCGADNCSIATIRLSNAVMSLRDDEPALCARVVRLSDDMLEFAEEPRDVLILDEKGEPLRAGDHKRRYFEAPGCINTTGSIIFVLYREYTFNMLCHRRQSIRTIHLSGCNIDAGCGMDYPSFHL